ncbi:MAG: M48 family metallopeptidase [Candidatus Levybacteria bacterium]|nr:M48 family metallopeptidase [Candidatus Levybacteria bacterium]
MILFVVFITTIVYVMSKALGFSAIGTAGIALIFAGLMSIGSYYYSDKLVLATTGARQIKKSDFPEYYRTVENLAIGAGLPQPKVYVIDDRSPNAFATGRDPRHAVVAATTGLLNMMSESELEGVIAHELSHVKNYDIRLMGVVAVLVGFVAILSDLFIRVSFFRGRDNDRNNGIFLIVAIVLAILSPIAAMLIQMAVSRKREFLADASGVLLTRYPEGLASALEKLKNDHTAPKSASNATAHLYIENPFDNKKVKNLFTSLFNTHPPLDERIKILRSM